MSKLPDCPSLDAPLWNIRRTETHASLVWNDLFLPVRQTSQTVTRAREDRNETRGSTPIDLGRRIPAPELTLTSDLPKPRARFKASAYLSEPGGPAFSLRYKWIRVYIIYESECTRKVLQYLIGGQEGGQSRARR